ncbi:MAG: DUF1573 domain-containing protein [Bacteroidota bacterium]
MPYWKHFTFLWILIASSHLSFAQAKINFIAKKISIDTLYEGELAPVKFIFQNIGDSNLIVSAVKSSCGCTVPKYDKKIIPPLAFDTILATYNTVGHLGYVNKLVQVESNASNGLQDLYIEGYAFPYEKNLRLYYSSSTGEVMYHVDKNKNITYSIGKSNYNRPPDISLVLFQEDNSKGSFVLNKEELETKGITLRIMKQTNSTVNIDYVQATTLELTKEYTYIVQFTLADKKNTFINATINGKKCKIYFNFNE